MKIGEESIEIVWSSDKTKVLSFNVNGEVMSREEFGRKIERESEALRKELNSITELEKKLFNPPVINQNAKLQRLEEAYPKMSNNQSRFFTLREIIRTREKIITNRYC